VPSAQGIPRDESTLVVPVAVRVGLRECFLLPFAGAKTPSNSKQSNNPISFFIGRTLCRPLISVKRQYRMNFPFRKPLTTTQHSRSQNQQKPYRGLRGCTRILRALNYYEQNSFPFCGNFEGCKDRAAALHGNICGWPRCGGVFDFGFSAFICVYPR
jgi:hypothetical protein